MIGAVKLDSRDNYTRIQISFFNPFLDHITTYPPSLQLKVMIFAEGLFLTVTSVDGWNFLDILGN
jgi:hypothetical protein